MNNTVKDCWKAFHRLVANTPERIDKGFKVNNDTVALEAGRARGSIKSGRDIFKSLIEEIDKFNADNKAPIVLLELKLEKSKAKEKNSKELYFESMRRELMLLERTNQLEKIVKDKKAVNNNIWTKP